MQGDDLKQASSGRIRRHERVKQRCRAGCRWRMAHALGDSAALRALRGRMAQMAPGSLSRIMGTGQLEGIGMGEVELAATLLESTMNVDAALELPTSREERLHHHAMNRGRPRRGLRLTERWPEGPRRQLWIQIMDALYWDGDSTAAARAVRTLAGISEGSPERTVDEMIVRHADICAVEQWRLWHGELTTVEPAIVELRKGGGHASPDSPTTIDTLCAALLDAQLARITNRSDVVAALGYLDSLTWTLPEPVSSHPVTAAILVLARLHERGGDLKSALAVVRRRPYHFVYHKYLSSFLRDEARLAALTGDREGAIRAYRHYLALRSDPEPPLEADVAAARAELDRLLREGRR